MVLRTWGHVFVVVSAILLPHFYSLGSSQEDRQPSDYLIWTQISGVFD